MINDYIAYKGTILISDFLDWMSDGIRVLNQITLKFVPKITIVKKVSISSDNGSAPNMQQTINWTNVHRGIYASPADPNDLIAVTKARDKSPVLSYTVSDTHLSKCCNNLSIAQHVVILSQ